MASFVQLLRGNRNYRYTWIGQVVSEIGDHFNNIAVFSLALATTRSGLVVSGVMLARAIPAVLAGPIAGVLLDRLDRKRVMIASDVIRAVLALGFILTIHRHDTWMLYAFSALLMFASPFFHQRTLRDPAQHRHQGRIAHGQLPDADHGLDHTNHRHVSGGRQRGAVRLSVGFRRQCACRSWYRRCASRGSSCPAMDSGPSAMRSDRSRSGAAVARIHRRAALHARRIR